MSAISREQLHAFLDDALSEPESARLERALRESEELRERLRQVMQERERGEHSVGGIWRRHRLSCASREQLGSYLLGVLTEEQMDYLRFHLDTVNCPYCLANLADLQAQQQEAGSVSQQRRKRFFQSSAGFLQNGERGDENR